MGSTLADGRRPHVHQAFHCIPKATAIVKGDAYDDNVTVVIEPFLRASTFVPTGDKAAAAWTAQCYDHDWGFDGKFDQSQRPVGVGMTSTTTAICCPVVPYRP